MYGFSRIYVIYNTHETVNTITQLTTTVTLKIRYVYRTLYLNKNTLVVKVLQPRIKRLCKVVKIKWAVKSFSC